MFLFKERVLFSKSDTDFELLHQSSSKYDIQLSLDLLTVTGAKETNDHSEDEELHSYFKRRPSLSSPELLNAALLLVVFNYEGL